MKCHLFLTGYRGTGKTSAGKELAKLLHSDLYDLDAVIQNGTGRSIKEIFESDGEQHFRDLESHYLNELGKHPPAVISLGGGAVLRAENRQWIASAGRCVWLQASPQTILARLKSDTASHSQRPALTKLPAEEEITKLLADRQTAYQSAADYSIVTDDLSAKEIAQAIHQWWLGRE